MRLKTSESALEGAYEPSYFFMIIDTTEKLDEGLDTHSQTFIHEYIHFIQDIFLSYCIRYNISEVNRFLSVTEKAKQGVIVRPFKDWSHETLCLDQQFEHTWGQTNFIDNVSHITDYESEIYLIKEIDARVFKYTANIIPEGTYQVGARDMLEYIAHKIESKHWPTEQPDIPYRTMELVFNNLQLGEMPTTCKIALIEFCLQNDNPVHHLFKTVETIRSGSLGVEGIEECLYDFTQLNHTLKRFLWGARGGFRETIETKVTRRLSTMKEYLEDKYPSNIFSDINTWINDVIHYVSTHLKGRLFFAELYEKDKPNFLAEIDLLISTLGIPLIFNAHEEHISLLPKKYKSEQFIQFYASYKFNEFLKTKEKTCPLCRYCENSTPDLMDDECTSNSILRAARDSSCPFGQFINNHDLNNME